MWLILKEENIAHAEYDVKIHVKVVDFVIACNKNFIALAAKRILFAE